MSWVNTRRVARTYSVGDYVWIHAGEQPQLACISDPRPKLQLGDDWHMVRMFHLGARRWTNPIPAEVRAELTPVELRAYRDVGWIPQQGAEPWRRG